MLTNKKIDQMTLKEKIGQLCIMGFGSPVYDDQIKKLVDDYALGNIILFNRNFQGANQMKALNKELYHNIYNKCGVIPFISIDQEGGLVTRLMKDVTFPPSQMTTSSCNIENATYLTGKMIGEDMIKLGLNVDFAPCLDINQELKNPIMNVRSYSSNPKLCGEYAKGFIKGLSEYGVLSCGKHFPGCDSPDIDSHLGLPILNVTKEEVHNRGLIPFKMNIDVPMIMTTHTIFSCYDKDYPSTLSKNVLTGLLKNELGYQGLITTDCLEMKAIADHYGTPKAAVLALKAGCDFVLDCHTLEVQIAVFEEIYKAVKDGILTEDEINEKVEKILKYKETIIPYLNKYFFNDEEYVENKENHTNAQKIVDSSLTLVLGDIPTLDNNTLIITPRASVSSIVEDEFDERNLKNALDKVFTNNTIIEFNEEINILDQTIKYNKIIIFSYGNNEYQRNIINNLLDTNKDIYVISLKGPMDLPKYINIKNYMCLYEYTPNSIKTVIKFLNGEIKPLGKLQK